MVKSFFEWLDQKRNLMAWFGGSVVRKPDGSPLVVYHGSSDHIREFDPEASDGLGSFARRGIFFTDSAESAGAYALQRDTLSFKRVVAAFNKAKEEYEDVLYRLAAKSRSHFPKSYGGETIPRMALSWVNDLHRSGKIDDEDYENYERAQDSLVGAEAEYELRERERWDEARPNTTPVYLRIERPHVVDAGGMPWDAVVPANLADFDPSKNDGIIFKNVVDNADESEAKTTVYVVFDPRNIKSAIGNDGEFDPNSADILR
jgi:hypothetical protein